VDPLVARVVIEDPGPGKRLDADSRSRLRGALRSHSRDESRCILLSVQGDAWHHAPESAGYDAGQLTKLVVSDDLQALVRQVFRLSIPLVVGLQGDVSGLGFALALAADIRVASPTTTFSLGGPETSAALLGGSTWLLAHTMDRGTLTHMAWTGAGLNASAAETQRLVSEVTTDDSAAHRLAEQLAGLPPQTASALKRALVSRHQPDFEAVLDYESWLVGVAAERDG
jgi:enoyl-CoA hydratase/carnithine racemase